MSIYLSVYLSISLSIYILALRVDKRLKAEDFRKLRNIRKTTKLAGGRG